MPAALPGGAVHCRARTTDEAETSGPSTNMTAPVHVPLASENMWRSMRAGTGRGRMAWPLTRHRFHSQQRIFSRRAGESWSDAPSSRENESAGGSNSMTRSIFRVRTRVEYPTAPQEDVMSLAMRPLSHETGRGLVGPPNAKLSKYSSLLAGTRNFCAARSTKVLSGASTTCHHEIGFRFVAPESLGRVDEPAEPREDAKKHLTHGFASLAVAAATATAKSRPS